MIVIIVVSYCKCSNSNNNNIVKGREGGLYDGMMKRKQEELIIIKKLGFITQIISVCKRRTESK